MAKIRLAAGVFLLVAAWAAHGDDKTGGAGKTPDLTGGYTMVSGERGGEKLGEDKVKGHVVRFTKDRIVVTDKEKNEVYVAKYELDSAKTPCGITMTSEIAPRKGETAKGLIEKDGDTVRLIYALPGGDVPTEFKTKSEKQIMVTMKNMKR